MPDFKKVPLATEHVLDIRAREVLFSDSKGHMLRVRYTMMDSVWGGRQKTHDRAQLTNDLRTVEKLVHYHCGDDCHEGKDGQPDTHDTEGHIPCAFPAFERIKQQLIEARGIIDRAIIVGGNDLPDSWHSDARRWIGDNTQ